ncbi:hypothetical protein NXG27_00950 [Megasphaera paucivorans]|uniref:Uncharacterized protein n=1 Tax=Megasphaera paucivorans TaxID=349095 RepID=A0A1G9QCJ1_9FIRM|nr:hypothetical protein [Megasphaera paucivorans]SDM08746.1 hypothetical protein SAMN05660299_00191 [Megasphaera paucivorans]
MAKRKKVKGFKNNAVLIAQRQGVSLKTASAELASGTRRASAGARRKNPALNKVRGK